MNAPPPYPPALSRGVQQSAPAEEGVPPPPAAADRPHAVLLYHYFHPDDVISARLFSDLAEGLVQRGWDVTAVPCQRGCRDPEAVHPLVEAWQGVRVHRVWRPAFRQSANRGRALNAAWMLTAWVRRCFSATCEASSASKGGRPAIA